MKEVKEEKEKRKSDRAGGGFISSRESSGEESEETEMEGKDEEVSLDEEAEKRAEFWKFVEEKREEEKREKEKEDEEEKERERENAEREELERKREREEVAEKREREEREKKKEEQERGEREKKRQDISQVISCNIMSKSMEKAEGKKLYLGMPVASFLEWLQYLAESSGGLASPQSGPASKVIRRGSSVCAREAGKLTSWGRPSCSCDRRCVWEGLEGCAVEGV